MSIERAEMVPRLSLEGNSGSSTERVTGVHHGAILKLLVLAGEKCEPIMAQKICNVEVRGLECDESWSFIGKKQKRFRPEDDQNLGDAYTFVAIEGHAKLVLNIAMGERDQTTTEVFIECLRHATSRAHFQITTDGFVSYKSSISNTLVDRCNFARPIKACRAAAEGEARHSPAEVAKTEVVSVVRGPDPDRICTSIVERSNVSTRMSTRRFTRLPNDFSKKWENHRAAMECWFCFYSFSRVHRSLRVRSEAAAGIADYVRSERELLLARRESHILRSVRLLRMGILVGQTMQK
jgi:IS1 family transposase